MKKLRLIAQSDTFRGPYSNIKLQETFFCAAYQRRDVVCQLHNGTVVSSSQCDERTRPRHRQECYNYQCSGVWRVGDWSEVR